MADCSKHQSAASGRCYSCHKPYCHQCQPVNGCCSQSCAEMRDRFSGLSKVSRGDPILPKLIKLGLVLAAAWAAWTFRSEILAKIKELF
jgi:hypothetical protein